MHGTRRRPPLDRPVLVLLSSAAAHLADTVQAAGATAVVDATGGTAPEVPDGAWVRTRPGRPAPGTGPVVLAELGAPVPGRPTWLETSVPRAVPAGFAGLVLKGAEAGGAVGDADGLQALTACPEPDRVILDGGVGPSTAAAAAALGAAGVLLVEQHLACPALGLPAGLLKRLKAPPDELTHVVAGWRVANPATSPALRRLLGGADPWALVGDVWTSGDLAQHLWPMGQALALAGGLADRFGTLDRLIRAYIDAWGDAPARTAASLAAPPGRVARSAAALEAHDAVATSGGLLGSGVLWELAAWLERPVAGEPLAGARATGCPVVGAAAPAPPATPPPPAQPASQAAAIAIIGIGCHFPGARGADAFWRNVVDRVSAIREVDPAQWDPALYWDPDPATPDRTYSKIGAFVDDFVFEPRRFRIPPRTASQIDPVQQLTLQCVADALDDAGLQVDRRHDGRPFDRERCDIILGNSLGGMVGDEYAVRLNWPVVEQRVGELPVIRALAPSARERLLAQMKERYLADLPEIDEDSMPGELSNVIAGRIANAFDLGGANFTVDAACASSMAAVSSAVKRLRAGECDLAISGGADRTMNAPTYVKFAKIGALSPDHSSPFDASANGFVMGEGCGIVVLKRYDDAVRDGDRIYSVIRGIGASSDGRGKGITAPNVKGQIRALERAYAASGVEPADVDLIEAHGTSTVVGDRVEVQALTEVIGVGARADRGPVRIGSVKSMIGHLKSAAGAASIIKASLALHHGVFPPSLGYRRASPDLKLGAVPLQVQTAAEPWPIPPSGVRRAGVSAFGFGGTNFHIVLEAFTGRALPSPPPPAPPAPQPPAAGRAFPAGVWATSAPDRATLLARMRVLRAGNAAPWDPRDALRIAGGTSDGGEAEQLDHAISALERGAPAQKLRARGVFLDDGSAHGELAFLFTGQGSQYLRMGLDLADAYPIVADTLEEADRRLTPELGASVTDLIRGALDDDPEDQARRLKATEHSQPATLVIDIAIARLLAAHGVRPSMVAGHSLGEYAAAVAAGVLPFGDALRAVTARGREMAAIRLDDPGTMAGIGAAPAVVEAVLETVDGYVVAANKNSPNQTVIAGASDAVDAACARFRDRGITVHPLAVSHAFHTAIVAPASAPLRGLLATLDIRPPHRPITTNVTGGPYPTDVGPIVDLLSRQIASPVEWTTQIERMYADGARTFVECGPKRALTGFAGAILAGRPHRAVATNHPKRGGVTTFRAALAALIAGGFPVAATPGSPALDGPASQAVAPAPPEPPDPTPAPVPSAAREPLTRAIGGFPTGDAGAFAAAVMPAVQNLLDTALAAARAQQGPTAAPRPPTVVCTGASIGLPGGEQVFHDDNILAILRGENRIRPLGSRSARFLEMGIVRLVKDADSGAGTFLPVEREDQVIRLAGTRGAHDLSAWGVPDNLTRAFDVTTSLAIAAALEALRDAGIPLVQRWRVTGNGRKVHAGWELPGPMRDTTGVIFASAFPGYTQLIEKLASGGDDGEGRFDRRFLFQVLAMGHSQLAQLIGARGPNTQVNAACASTTQAVTLAADWIRLVRGERVIVGGADDVTNPQLLPWIGSGFMAAGAATTAERVEDAALPFDRRRHGMILGMGAVGMVVEHADAPARRGVRPIARLVADALGNSAFHGTRLDTTHIRDTVADLVRRAAEAEGTTPSAVARSAFFMSHETYTPARGGSAAAEVAALRAAFGDAAADLVIANTKGFTGHPMGAGIEDAVAVKGLQYGVVPPVPNHREPDPDLGPLRLSTGERADYRYALRLAAGFGSQLAVCLWARESRGDDRLADPHRRAAWLREVTGFADVAEVVEQRTLRATQAQVTRLWNPSTPESPARWLGVPEAHRTPDPALRRSPSRPPSRPRDAQPPSSVIASIVAVVAEKTGYDAADIDPDDELEADLGIDTVKQAEIVAELTSAFGLSDDPSFRFSDHPTLRALARYVEDRREDAGPPREAAVVVADAGRDAMLDMLVEIVAVKTGYDAADLDPDDELEADLGIDTVKQAEIIAELTDRLALPTDDEFRMADHPTLAALAAYLASRMDAPAHPRSAPAAPILRPAAAVGPTAIAAPGPEASGGGSSLRTLVAVVAAKTGYDPEDLDIDDELEADLGIDTVKQAEIVSDLGEQLGISLPEDFRIADYPTLRALAGWLDGAPRRNVGGPSDIDGRVEAPEPAPLADVVDLTSGFALEPDAFDDLSPALPETPTLPPTFRVRRPVLVERPHTPTRGLGQRKVRVLGQGSVATAVRHEVTSRGGSLDRDADTVIDCTDDVLASFRAAQARDGDRPRIWVTVTRGGGLGSRASVALADAHRDGARAGLAKALGREWDETAARVVDIEPFTSSGRAARQICDELHTHGPTEVFLQGDRRLVVGYAIEDLPETVGTGPQAILITGGGRGISARVAEAFAHRVPGCRLVLVGRTPPADAPLDESAERARLREALRAAGDRPTPVRLEAALRPLRKADEVRQTMRRLADAGATASFLVADLSDPQAVASLPEAVPAIDVVVHGAGVEESRMIADKDEGAFHRVFDGKAVGGLALARAFPDAFFVSMGSVAGRFGNAGQVDYAAANDALARTCLTRGDALHVDWTAWDDVGMAVRGGMRHLLERRGVDLLPADAGASLLVDLVCARVGGELVVAGRLPGFDAPAEHALLDRVQLDGDRVTVQRTMSIASDPWLADHAVDGVPVLPGVVGVELMVAAALHAHPTGRFAAAHDVTFAAPIKLFPDRPVVVSVDATPGAATVPATVFSERPVKGRVQRREHFTGTIVLEAETRLSGLPAAILPDEEIGADAIYARFFHGPRFRVLTRALSVARDGVVVLAQVPDALAPDLWSAPLTLEAAFQSAGLHRMVVEGARGLPAGFRHLQLYDEKQAARTLEVTARLGDDGTYDVDVVGRAGPVLRLRGLRFTDPEPLPPALRFPDPPHPRPSGFATPVIARATPDDGPAALLSAEEVAALTARGRSRRVADRIAGRIAAKRALVALTGASPDAVRVHTAPSGAPVAEVLGHPDVRVSISHRAGHAVAAAVRGPHIGIDTEPISARPAAFTRAWFTAAEQRLAGDDAARQTAVWCTKEAVLKALGLGLTAPTRCVEVTALRPDGSVAVRLTGPAAAAHDDLGGGAVTVHRVRRDDHLEVVCQVAA